MNALVNHLNIIKYLIYFIPVALLTGSFMPDLLLTLSVLFLLTYSIYNKVFIEIFFFKKIIIFYIFFLSLVISSLLSDYILFSLSSSLPYSRILLFLVVVKYIHEKDKEFLKNFLPFLLIPLLAVFLTGYYEVFFSNTLNEHNGQVTGLFERKILGSFLSRISPLFLAILFLYNGFFEKPINKIFFVIIFLLILTLIVLSGERVATINFVLFSLFIIFFNISNLRKIILSSLLVFISLIFIFKIIFDSNFRVIDTTIKFSGIEQNKILFFSDHHHLHMLSAISIFKDNIFFGSGPKTFRLKCKEPEYNRDALSIFTQQYIDNLSHDDYYRLSSLNSCNTHPHHIFLQLLSETGIVGFSFLLFLFYFCIKKLFILDKNDNLWNFKLSLIFLILVNVSPFTPSGNIFNNYFSIIIILPIALFLASDN